MIPLLVTALPLVFAQAAWTDPSPHTVRFVDVAPSVKLEVLDWGGTGRDVVLLSGSGNTAHVYDEFALKLKDCCHVYGVTRRGYGASSQPTEGYDEPSLGRDVWTVIDTLGLKAPVVIGHSMAGAELTDLGMKHSDRLGGLVYMDAIGDSTDDPPDDPAFKATQARLPPSGPPKDCPNDRSTFAAFRASLACRHGIALPESELRAGFEANADGSVGAGRTPGWVGRAIGTGRPPRDYSKITVPVLALSDAVDFDLSRLKPDQFQIRNDDDRAAIIAFGKATQAVFDRWSAKLKRGVPSAKIVDMPGATHYLWMTREADVLKEIHAFIAGLPERREPAAKTLARAYAAYDTARRAKDVAALVRVDGDLRAVRAIRPYVSSGALRRGYERLGLAPAVFDVDVLAYSGKVLREAHAMDPHSNARPFTLYSTIFPDGEAHVRTPDVAAARAYLREFPEGPFAPDVHRVLGDFHDDLFKVLRAGAALVDYKRACFQRFVTKRPVAEQLRAAQRAGVGHYRAALALRPSDRSARDVLRTLEAGTSTGWHYCAD